MENDFFIVLSVVAGLAFWAYVIIIARQQRRISAPVSPSNASASNRLGLVVGRFVGGHYGLPRTFWLYYLLLGNIFSGVVYFATKVSPSIGLAGLLLWFGYLSAASVAVWVAATKHSGLLIWKVLAKILVLLPLVGFLIALVIGVLPHQSAKSMKYAEPTHASKPIDWEKGVITPPQVTQAQPATSDAETTAHYQTIYQAHPDADAVANSAQFQHWLNMYPAYRTVMEKGSTQQTIEMFTAFKMQSRHINGEQ